MSDVKLIPTGLDKIISPSATLSAWGYRPELFEEKKENNRLNYLAELEIENQRLRKRILELERNQ